MPLQSLGTTPGNGTAYIKRIFSLQLNLSAGTLVDTKRAECPPNHSSSNMKINYQGSHFLEIGVFPLHNCIEHFPHFSYSLREL